MDSNGSWGLCWASMPTVANHCLQGVESVTSVSLPFTRVSLGSVTQWFYQEHVDLNSITILPGEALVSPNFIKILFTSWIFLFLFSFLRSWFYCFFPEGQMFLCAYLQPEFGSPRVCSLRTLILFPNIRLFLSPHVHLPLSSQTKTCSFSLEMFLNC